MAREQGPSVHIVLIEFAGNDNIADVQAGSTAPATPVKMTSSTPN